MTAAALPTHDAPVPCHPIVRMWALIQTAPLVEVLATSTDRHRLVMEAKSLYGLDVGREDGSEPAFRLALRPTLFLE